MGVSLSYQSAKRVGIDLQKSVQHTAAAFLATVMLACAALPQTTESDKPVPILTGNVGTFSFVTGGHNLVDTQINPVLLVPLGDRWLIEARAEFEGQFQRPADGGP